MTTYFYRCNKGPTGQIEHDGTSDAALQQAFNVVADKLVADGWIKGDWQRRVRHEGKVKIDGRKYLGLHQAGVIVVAGKMPPAVFELTF